jgi:bacillithiol biosynthesis cysteine-adding enzyme BshC
MNLQYISFQSARIGSALFHDYISESPALASFYAFSPRTDAVQMAIHARIKKPVKREQLVSILHDQYQGFPLSERLKENIQSLKNENTFTITTGHQLSLMSGPLYFLYKIISVIALSERCKEQYPEYHFVPVYWMNSEDHDFEEINHIWINNQRFVWPRPVEKKIAVGRMPMMGLDLFFDSLPDLLRLSDCYKVWKNIYLESKNLAEATRKLVNHLLGDYGLVIIDQDDVRLKRLAFDVFYKELTQHDSFRLVNETSAALESLGYHTQVKPREVNLFYHHPEAGRQRIVLENDKIRILNTNLEFHASEIDGLSDKKLECFSTNVVTRPLYQQSVLPDIIYVGGPAEVSYWLQYKSMFDHYDVFYPMLLMRDSLLILNSSVARKVKKLGIGLEELFAEESIWQKTQISRLASEVNFKPVQDTIEQTYQQLANELAKVDPTLKPAALAEMQKQLHALKHLESKYLRAWKQKNETLVRQLQEIRDTVFPGGELQERHNNVWAYTADPHPLIRQIISIANPWKQMVKIVEI